MESVNVTLLRHLYSRYSCYLWDFPMLVQRELVPVNEIEMTRNITKIRKLNNHEDC